MIVKYRCKGCGAILEIDAKNPKAAESKLRMWTSCPVGKHQAQPSMAAIVERLEEGELN